MNATILANAIRERAEQLQNLPDRREYDFDNAELLRVLARIVEGKTIAKSFGAPGDWGYSHPIGKAIAAQGHAPEPVDDGTNPEMATAVKFKRK